MLEAHMALEHAVALELPANHVGAIRSARAEVFGSTPLSDACEVAVCSAGARSSPTGWAQEALPTHEAWARVRARVGWYVTQHARRSMRKVKFAQAVTAAGQHGKWCSRAADAVKGMYGMMLKRQQAGAGSQSELNLETTL